MRDKQRIETAIAAVEQALKIAKRRAEKLQKAREDSMRARQRWLAEYVADLLPSFSKAVLVRLRDAVPGFVGQAVQNTFATNRKFMGLFAGADYKRDLAFARVRLASYLDQNKYGEVRTIDKRLSELGEEYSLVTAKLREGEELLSLLEEALHRRVVLPPLLDAQLARFSRPKEFRPRLNFARSPSRAGSSSSSTSDSDDDLFFFFLTDIPTSVRTLLLSEIVSEREHERRRSEDAMPSADSYEPADSAAFHHHHKGDWDQSQANDDVNHAAAAAATIIATDDSLGYFS